MIFDMLETMPYTTNCYLIGDDAAGVCAVVDPGGNPEKILDMVQKSGLKLEKILLTHGHYDHVGGVDALVRAAPGAAVYIHRADTQVPDRRLYPPLKVDCNFYAGGDTLSVGSVSVRVLHTPGHTPGSVTLLAEDRMFSGDTLFALGCGRWDMAGGDMYDLIGSLATLGDLKENYKVFPGHGENTELDFERRSNPYLKQALDI